MTTNESQERTSKIQAEIDRAQGKLMVEQASPFFIRDITGEVVSRWEKHSMANVRKAAMILRGMVERHQRGDWTPGLDQQAVDTANFYLPAGMCIRYR